MNPQTKSHKEAGRKVIKSARKVKETQAEGDDALLEELARVPALSNLSSFERRLVAKRAARAAVAPGEAVEAEGVLVVVLSGRLSVLRDGNGHEGEPQSRRPGVPVAELGALSYFGDLGFLPGEPSFVCGEDPVPARLGGASVVAEEASALVRLDAAVLSQVPNRERHSKRTETHTTHLIFAP